MKKIKHTVFSSAPFPVLVQALPNNTPEVRMLPASISGVLMNCLCRQRNSVLSERTAGWWCPKTPNTRENSLCTYQPGASDDQSPVSAALEERLVHSERGMWTGSSPVPLVFQPRLKESTGKRGGNCTEKSRINFKLGQSHTENPENLLTPLCFYLPDIFSIADGCFLC